MLMLSSAAPPLPKASSLTPPSSEQLTKAAAYIANTYNPHVGLVTESEDTGSNVPNGTPAYRTFWIFSDNLWASEALKAYFPKIAMNISISIPRFINKYGNSQLFEVVLAQKIPNPIHAGTDVNASSFSLESANYSIYLDRHGPQDGGIFYDANRYADLDFYLSLDNYLSGNLTVSEWWFRQGESMWDGHGFYDKAAQQSATNSRRQSYQNYKLGLYLFTAKATGFVSPIYNLVEPVAWSYQKQNGGIATLSYLNRSVYGTANVETTSALLLAYDQGLLTTRQCLWKPCDGRLLALYLSVATAGIIAVGASFSLALQRHFIRTGSSSRSSRKSSLLVAG
jgi:hypothetical protein